MHIKHFIQIITEIYIRGRKSRVEKIYQPKLTKTPQLFKTKHQLELKSKVKSQKKTQKKEDEPCQISISSRQNWPLTEVKRVMNASRCQKQVWALSHEWRWKNQEKTPRVPDNTTDVYSLRSTWGGAVIGRPCWNDARNQHLLHKGKKGWNKTSSTISRKTTI